jgi:chromosome segregation ATPase
MSKTEKNVPELVLAAEALEAELAKLEGLSRAVRKIPLSSERSITRAAKELSETATLQERLAEGLQGLARAMARLQGRQQAALEPLAAFANAIQARMLRLSELMHDFAALGAAATEATTLIQATTGDHSHIVAVVDEQLSKISEGARALLDAARADDFPDVAREAEALKQRLAALRKKLEPKA